MLAAASPLLVDYTSPDGPLVSQVRSTLLSSSITTLREHGHFDRYLRFLPKEHHDAVLLTLAPTWLPLDVGVAHYQACDALELPPDELDSIGEAVAQRIMGTFLGHLVRSTRNVGMSPWVPFKRYGRLWSRLLLGGRCRVHELGPKDARIESYGCPLFRFRYFSTAYLGVIKGAALMFSKTVYVNRLSGAEGGDDLTAKVSWV